MSSTALVFFKDKRVIDHYSIFAPEAEGFSQGLLSLGYNVCMVQINTFTNRKFVTIYVHNTLHG